MTRAIALAAAMMVVTANVHAACNDKIPDMQRRVGPGWSNFNGFFNHPGGAAMNFQCNDGEPLRAYIQLPVEGTDISPSHNAIAEVAENLMLTDVPEQDVRRCILAVKKTTNEDIWLGVGKFGAAFECGKDRDSHYFRIQLESKGSAADLFG